MNANENAGMPLSIAQAIEISDVVPPDLLSLRIHQRPSSGPTVRICAVGDITLSGRVSAAARAVGASALLAEIVPVPTEWGCLLCQFGVSAGRKPPARSTACSAVLDGCRSADCRVFTLLHLANKPHQRVMAKQGFGRRSRPCGRRA